MENDDYGKGGVVHQQNTPGELGSEIVVPIKLMMPNCAEDLESFIDSRIEYKIKQMMLRGRIP